MGRGSRTLHCSQKFLGGPEDKSYPSVRMISIFCIIRKVGYLILPLGGTINRTKFPEPLLKGKPKLLLLICTQSCKTELFCSLSTFNYTLNKHKVN